MANRKLNTTGFGNKKIGLSTQGVLWSDAAIYTAHSESGGNTLMFALTEFALQLIKGREYTDPVELQHQVFDDICRYGQKITNNPNLRKTVALNALVALDNAAWLIYAAETKITSFDDMIPEKYRSALSNHHSEVASIPLISYAAPVEEITVAIDAGYFFMKIKIGQPGTQSAMLAKDLLHCNVHRSKHYKAMTRIRTYIGVYLPKGCTIRWV
ncbi:MAG: hypothetical protein ABIN89_00395 [Chitinophagaceae bacterium]